MDLTRDEQGRPIFARDKALAIQAAFLRLACMMERLRENCPWDREQTPDSLKKHILEEAYEVLEAIEARDWQGLKEELGDFLFQVLFQARIQSESERFDIEDVLGHIVEKMVRRHPHVFGETRLTRPEEVSVTWEKIKQKEKGGGDHLFDGFTKGFPALLESYKITKKAAKVGFDWDHPGQVLDKIEEEIAEVLAAQAEGNSQKLAEELGDMLFAMSNLVRKHGFEPEETLRAANRKFIRRFTLMERLAREDGLVFAELSLERQEVYWQKVKLLARGG